MTDTHLALQALAAHGVQGAGLAVRAVENAVLSAAIAEVSKEESAERLSHSSAAFVLEKLNRASNGVNKIFPVLRSIGVGGGRGGEAQLRLIVDTLKGTLPEEEVALERLGAHKLTLVSDAPEFVALAFGAFQGEGGGRTLQLRIGSNPSQGGAAYHLEVTTPDGKKERRAGKLGPYGAATLTIPAPKLNTYSVDATVVGAVPIHEEFSTGRSCPGGSQSPVLTLQHPFGSTGPADIPISITAEVDCQTADGKPHAPPAFSAFTEGGAALPIKDGKIADTFQSVQGFWIYRYDGTVTISADTRYYTVVTWH
jgi:hypothetical protein